MEAVYYWLGAVLFWLVIVPIGSVFTLAILIWMHRYFKRAYRCYRQGIELQLLPLYVRLAMDNSSAAKVFMIKLEMKSYQKHTHLRVMFRLLNALHTLRKP